MGLVKYLVKQSKLTCQFKSPISGLYWHEFTPQYRLTKSELDTWIKYQLPIDVAMPNLTPPEYNLFLTGYTLKEQENLKGNL